MKTYIKFFTVIAIFVASCFMTGCTNDPYWANSTLSKNEYESILKKEINGLIAQSGRLEESFFFLHGMPVWESLKWVNVDSKDMLVIPLLSSNSQSKKHIVGVVENEKISAVITELFETDISRNQIFSLNNQVLYNGESSTFSPRLKNGSEVEYLLLNGGSAQALFNAVENAGTSYNQYAIVGTLTINVIDVSGSASSSNTSGHAWIEFADNSGNTTTFGTWGNQGAVEYDINREKDYVADASYSVSITYNDFQNILDYNATDGNTNWSLIYNCAGYAAGIWQAVTGISIGGGILTPSHIRNWINNQ
jgi:hypothetical protein